MLISSIEKIVFQGIRGIKENMTSLLFKNMIPKRTFLLLGRLDIFLNIRLYPKVRSNNVGEHKKRQARRSSFYFGTPSFLSEKRGSVFEDTIHHDSTHIRLTIGISCKGYHSREEQQLVTLP